MSFPGEYRVEWMSPEETYMHLENTGSKIYRGLVETVGIKKSAGREILQESYERLLLLLSARFSLTSVSNLSKLFILHSIRKFTLLSALKS